MGLIESIMSKFGWTKSSKVTYVNFLDGNGSFFNQFGDNIYASDVVQQAINSIVSEMKKLNPKHIINLDGEDKLQFDNIQRVLENPNPLMTTSYYIEKMTWNLFLNYNAFAYPMWKDGKLVSIMPLQPTDVEFFMTPDEKIVVKMQFRNGYVADDIPYENLIHLRKNFSVNDIMGGNEKGQPDNAALLETLKLNDKLLKGLAKQMNMAMNVQGFIKHKTIVGLDAQLASIKDFETKVANAETAFLPVDLTTEIAPLNKQIQFLSKDILEFLDYKILRYYGVSIPIVTGNYNNDQFNAFSQKVLEPLIVDFEQTHTKALFSDRASFGYGHKIRFYQAEMIHMNPSQKLEYYKMLVDIGGCYKNEVRTAFGNHPLAELEGQIAVSSNQQNAVNNKVGGDANEQ